MMPSWDPDSWVWGEALDLFDRAERLQRQFFRLQLRSGAPVWVPPVDVFEQGDALLVVVALPDVPPAQVEVVIDADGLLVRGERRLPEACRQARIRQMEMPYGLFERRIVLPGTFELVRRSIGNGCLVLNLRRSEGAAP
ncbi:MAG: Hsp20/alpha crystallin family protein [Rhodocyclaceae bacterium]|nr:Hsp20/alpha crystallin family protein [Rhodocyclaceae bacterium]